MTTMLNNSVKPESASIHIDETQQQPEVKDSESFAEMNGVKFGDADKTQQPIELHKVVPEPDQIVTTRSVSQQPAIKSTVIGVGVLMFVGSIGLMANVATNSLQSGTTSQAQPSPTPSTSPTPEIKDENGQVKTALAITTQKGELQNLNKQQIPSDKQKLAQPSITPEPATSSNRRVSQQPQSQPRTVTRQQPSLVVQQPRTTIPAAVNYAAPPLTTQPRPMAASAAITPQAKTSSVSPMEQWLAASNVGSFSANTVDTALNESSSSGIEGGTGQPKPSLLANNTNSRANEDSQANSLENVDYNSKRVLVGSRAEGKLETPIALTAGSVNQVNQKYLIRLTKPLKAFDGTEVLPENSYLVVVSNNTNSSELIQMSAISALINRDGNTEEKSIPENSVLILGKNGEILKAELRKGSNLGSNLMAAVVAGVSKAAEIKNRPTSSTSISSSEFSTSTTTNDNRSLVAGFAEGTFSQILQNIQTSNQQQLQGIESQQKVFVIEAGKTVQVFVNQTILL